MWCVEQGFEVPSLGFGAGSGFWSTMLEYFFLVPVPLRNHYEIRVYTFFSLVTSKPS